MRKSRSTSGISGPNPWQGIIDAADSAAQRFSDPVAMDGVNAAATAASAIEALGRALKNVGKTASDAVYYDPRVVAYMEGLGDFVLKAVGPTQDTGEAIIRAHRDDIDRVTEASPKKARWDIAAHQGRTG